MYIILLLTLFTFCDIKFILDLKSDDIKQVLPSSHPFQTI